MKHLALLLLLLASTAASADIFRPWAPEERRTDYIGAAADTKPTSNVKRGSKAVEYDTNKTYRWTGREDQGASTDWKELYEGVTLGTRLAGERNEDSTTGTDYLSTSEECKTSAIIDLATDASTTVYNGPAILNWAYLSVTIGTEAATIDDNATAKIPLPVSLAVGVHPFKGARFDTSLVVNPGTNSTGTLTLCYRPLDAGVTY